ncbi:LysR family transcriptional regulator [Microbacterium deminutum]|uniref:LysR family transcriptional regulator n=1 Tax=Microbacterium deminutum TaxID=344164 RepID=A0ABP5BYN9_9MICO
MEIRHLRHFLAVAETLNFSRAAEALRMSAPPLSRSIQQLEIEIGDALFVRGTRKVELTPLGHSLVPHASRILQNMEELNRDMRRRVRGHVEVNIGMRSVPPELTRALTEAVHHAEPESDVRLEPLDSLTQLEQIVSGKLSLGLVNQRLRDRRLEYLPVLREAPGIALPDQPRFADLSVVQPADLAGLRLLIQPGADPTAEALEPIVRSVREVVQVSSDIVGGLSAIISQGRSCCLTLANPTAPWHKYLAGDGVIVRPLALKSDSAITYLCWRVDRDRPDDLAPILQVARERFATPVDL